MSLSRRDLLFASLMSQTARAAVKRAELRATRNRVTEWSLSSSRRYRDPFNEVALDVLFAGPGGKEWRVPAFWAGEQDWTVRFAPPEAGAYRFRTICTDASNPDLHDITDSLVVEPYTGPNLLYRRGGVQVAASRRHFEYADGTPFFWLADTWWGALAKRFRWPEDFHFLTADRARKGFNAIQLAAAFPPIMGPFDPRAEGDGGYPWERDFKRINRAYWDMADLRIRHLVEQGLLPCIFAGWGYNILKTGVDTMKKHWRYIVARWGAYPVVWSLCGEVDLPWYTSTNKAPEREQQIEGWIEVGKYLRSIDAYRRPVTIHPLPTGGSGRKAVGNAPILDFDMLQSLHGEQGTIPHVVGAIRGSASSKNPEMPVLVAEICYEGVFGEGWESRQRAQFWIAILSGALAGYTYGASGIWEVNTETEQAGVAPDGINWGITPWRQAAQFPGSAQLRHSKELLMQYPWWRLEPRPDWAAPHWRGEAVPKAFAAGIPGELRIYYTPAVFPHALPVVKGLEPGTSYRAFYFDPIRGRRYDSVQVTPSSDGSWRLPKPPVVQDWVIVLQARDYPKHPDCSTD